MLYIGKMGSLLLCGQNHRDDLPIIDMTDMFLSENGGFYRQKKDALFSWNIIKTMCGVYPIFRQSQGQVNWFAHILTSACSRHW